MKFLAAAAGFFLCGVTAAAAAPAQQLSIAIRGNAAVAQAAAAYTAGAPIDVRVTAPAGGVDAIELTLSGPSGAPERTRLERAADGAFKGTLTLADVGSWTLSVAVSNKGLVTESAPVVLRATAQERDDAWLVGVAVGGGLFLIGIGGFLRLRRSTAAAHRAGAARAA